MIKNRKPVCFGLLGISLFVCSPLYAGSAGIIPVTSSSSQSQSVLGSTVIPYKEVTLTAQTPGVVKLVAGNVGSRFDQGATLVQVDDSQLQAKRSAVLAQISSAQSGVMNAQSQFNREQVSPRSKDVGAMPGFGMPAMFDMLGTRTFAKSFMGGYDDDAIRQADLENSRTAVSQAQSGLQQATAQLQELDAAIGDTTSVAPFAGMILSKQAEIGDTVQPGQPLLTFGDVTNKRLQSDVPAGLVSHLQVGMQVAANINGNLRTTAKVAEIYPVADPVRHTVTVKFDLPAGIETAPGMYAEVQLPESKGKNSVSIPRSALLGGGSLPSVLVVRDGKSTLRMLRLGTSLADGQVEVVSGLEAQEQIINNPPAGASSGWMPATH